MKVFSILFLCIASILIVSVFAVQSEYQNPYDGQKDKIIGLKHFEEFLRDLEHKIAEWTRRFRDNVVVDNDALAASGGRDGQTHHHHHHHQLVRRQTGPSGGDSPSGGSDGGYSGDGDGVKPPPVSEWIVVKDIIEGAKFARKQLSDFIDRVTRLITGDQTALYRQSASNTGPYVPFVKELREFMVFLQKRITAWSNELERIFLAKPATDYPILH